MGIELKLEITIEMLLPLLLPPLLPLRSLLLLLHNTQSN